MSLRDFIKPKQQEQDNEITEKIINTFEKNMELYKDKSIGWNIRVTADEVGIKLDSLRSILDTHYNGEE